MRVLPFAAALFAAAIAALGGLVPSGVAASAAAKPASLTRADRRAIDATLDAFVIHAVRRQNVAASYDVVTPALRAGMSRAEWARGDIPAYPYPAQGRTFHAWTLAYAEPNEVGVNLLLHPRRGPRIGPISFDVTLKRIHGSWLVDLFLPAATFAPAGGPAKVRAVPDFSPQPQAGGANRDRSRLGRGYAVIPFALLGLLVAGLGGWALARWYRERRLMAAQPRTLPPWLPPSIQADDARARPRHHP